MSTRAFRLQELVSLLRNDHQTFQTSTWSLQDIAGRFVELSGCGASAVLTAAFGLVVDAQRNGEPVAWVSLPHSIFFPPDAADNGVDLDSLAVVRAPDSTAAARSAIQLVRSGAFGLVLLDFGPKTVSGPSGTLATAQQIPLPLQTRLVGLAQKHETAVVVLTEKTSETQSLGSLVSLRAQIHRKETSSVSSPDGRSPNRFEVHVQVIKDKRRGPGKTFREVCHGPDGLC